MASSARYIETDEEARDLKVITDYIDKEDDDVRQEQVRYWKRLKYYWNNFSQVFWSGQDNDYRIAGRDDVGNGDVNNQAYYDRPVNVFKAFLETIIAALSIHVPSITCVPDDADNPLDLSTAKAGNIISKQIYKHNNVIMLWLQALYIYCTEGLIAFYSYAHKSDKYGTYRTKKYKDEEVSGYFCPNCKNELDEEQVIYAKAIRDSVANKFNPDEADSEIEGLNEFSQEEEELEPITCPACSVEIDPELARTKNVIKRFVGFTDNPKSRICIEVYGGLYVKVPNYAKKQEDCPYLRFSYETFYGNALEEFADLRDKLPEGGWSNNGLNDPYEQYARLNIQYRNSYPRDLVTVSHYWVRPAQFNILDKEKAEKYKKKYPNGCCIAKVNDIIAKYCAESLDDHWTLSHNPMSDYLTHQPLGEVVTNIQDIINDLISLTIQTIEHGIPTTWVKPDVVNVNAYGQIEATPGNIVPTKTQGSDVNISNAFYTGTTATLAPEVLSFYNIINQLGQFVSGALPSIFGGALQSGGETASEYKMSQSMALQRLQTPWRMMTVVWKEMFGKVIPQYMELMVEDERLVERNNSGDFINVFIRKAETEGKIGDVELDNSDQLPISEEQQKAIIMELLALNNMEVMGALVAPENLPYVRKIVRIPEFKMPGEEDRQKQLEEIKELLATVPIPDVASSQPGMEMEAAGSATMPEAVVEQPSVPIDPILDNHQVEAEICRSWLISEVGRFAKKENELGYKNVLLHFSAHVREMNKIAAQAKAMQPVEEESTKGSTPSKTDGKTSEGKAKEGNNVPVQ